MITGSKDVPAFYSQHGDMTWQDLYTLLRPIARHIVYALCVPSWRGQENDIVEDIVQETVRKLIERMRKADRKEATPIYALKPMARVIAYNYGKDMRRHDQRINRIVEQDDLEELPGCIDDPISTEEWAIENAYREAIFTDLAPEIARFPLKQRTALLSDLANRMSFEQQATPLQKAFLKVGIQLQEYQHMSPASPEERNKYTSLLAHAYRRITTLSCAQAYAASKLSDDALVN